MVLLPLRFVIYKLLLLLKHESHLVILDLMPLRLRSVTLT